MAPNGWATPKQTLLLTSLLPEYEKCQINRRYKPFWTLLYARYLSENPLSEVLFPGLQIQDLDESQMTQYRLALDKLQSRLREWYRWRLQRSKPKGSRYCTLPRSSKRSIAHAPEVPRRTKHSRSYIQLRTSTPTRRRKSLRKWIDYVELNNEEEEEEESVVDPPVRKAGLMALITLVGPVPDANGKISAWTLQFGDKTTLPYHDRVYVEAVARFAKRHVFPSESVAVQSEDARSKSEAASTSETSQPSVSAGLSTPNASEHSNLPEMGSSAGKKHDPEEHHHQLPSPAIQARSAGSDLSSLSVPAGKDPLLEDEHRSPSPEHPVLRLPTPPRVYPSYLRNPPVNLLPKVQQNNPWDIAPSSSALGHFPKRCLTPPIILSIRTGFLPGTSSSILNDHYIRDVNFDYGNPPTSDTESEAHQHLLPFAATAPLFDLDDLYVTPSEEQSASERKLPSRLGDSLSSEGLPKRPSFGQVSSEGWKSSNGHLLSNTWGSKASPAGYVERQFNPTFPLLLPLNSRASSPKIASPIRDDPSFDTPPASSPPLTELTPPQQEPLDLVLPSRMREACSPATPPTSSPSPAKPSPAKHQTADPNLGFHVQDKPSSSTLPASNPAITEASPTQQRTINTILASPNGGTPSSPTPPASSPPPAQLDQPVDSNPASPASSIQPSIKQTSQSQPRETLKATSEAHPPTPTRALPETSRPQGSSHVYLASPKPVDDPDRARPLSPVGDAVSTSTEGVRRSRRAPVPSKTLERLQQIGTNALIYSSPVVKSSGPPPSAPGWYTAALADLKDTNLGAAWVALVEKWDTLEQALGYGTVARGSMPVKERPEEWAKWTTKGTYGARNHSRPPFIDDPADNWHGDHTMRSPAPIYNSDSLGGDVWGPLRKSGANGTVALMMLMLWWGRAAAPGPDLYREDSRDAWKALVDDVTMSFTAIIETNPSRGHKRIADENTVSDPSVQLAKSAYGRGVEWCISWCTGGAEELSGVYRGARGCLPLVDGGWLLVHCHISWCTVIITVERIQTATFGTRDPHIRQSPVERVIQWYWWSFLHVFLCGAVRGARGLVHGAWCLVLGAWCLVLGAWCLVPGAWCMVLGACCVPVEGQSPVSNTVEGHTCSSSSRNARHEDETIYNDWRRWGGEDDYLWLNLTPCTSQNKRYEPHAPLPYTTASKSPRGSSKSKVHQLSIIKQSTWCITLTPSAGQNVWPGRSDTLSGRILRVAKSRNLLETTKGAIPMTDPAFDGQAIRLRRKAALHPKSLLAQTTPEVDGDSSSAENGPAPTKEVLVLFAPPGYFASRGTDVAEATQPAKFTEGTEANKKTVRFSDQLVSPASTTHRRRIALSNRSPSALSARDHASQQPQLRPPLSPPRAALALTTLSRVADGASKPRSTQAKWDFCFEKWAEHCESATHVEKLRSISAKASGAAIKASKGKGKGKAT
ncbi:hypothetical protein DFP72DRAFT_854878 [Ephemerocybe angulata]|uniref:Uncharacterized protein n=1 Tax=Ephemerocybe angulata TaxID=980116 RepID=A0A8H6HHA4_9AGAR|nr:hypothetical protein DFP72DRAFT_854878 [Tulosesus angulatus]